MTFCKDCKFYKPKKWWEPKIISKHSKCLHSLSYKKKPNEEYYRVTGNKIDIEMPDPYSCCLMRAEQWPCGPEAKLFEPKP